MSNPTPPPPDWLPYAIDRLKDVGLDEAAGWLETHLALVAHTEDDIRDHWDESTRATHVTAVGHAHWGPLLAIVAQARGETPEEAFGRLAPTWHMPDERPTPPTRNPWAAAIDMAPMIERELERRRQGVEDFLRENNANPAIHEHVVYPAPEDSSPDFGADRPPRLRYAARGHIHALIPWADMEGRSMRPTRDEVVSRGTRWPWRLI